MDGNHETKLEIVREFCRADRVNFDAESIEESSGRGHCTVRWSDGEVVALEVAELGSGGGLPVVFGKDREDPTTVIPVDLLIYCDTEPRIDVAAVFRGTLVAMLEQYGYTVACGD